MDTNITYVYFTYFNLNLNFFINQINNCLHKAIDLRKYIFFHSKIFSLGVEKYISISKYVISIHRINILFFKYFFCQCGSYEPNSVLRIRDPVAFNQNAFGLFIVELTERNLLFILYTRFQIWGENFSGSSSFLPRREPDQNDLTERNSSIKKEPRGDTRRIFFGETFDRVKIKPRAQKAIAKSRDD